MNICIVDDNLAFTKELETTLFDIFKELGCEFGITCCHNSQDFLEYSSKEKYDLIFMDIEVDDENGIDLANDYSKINSGVMIIFITNYGDKYSQAIFLSSADFKPFGYITKPINKGVVRKLCLHACNRKNLLGENVYTILSHNSYYDVKMNEIMYVESFGRKVTFYMESGESFDSYKVLGHVLEELDKNFVRCHRSFVVNLDYVRIIDEKNSSVTLKNGAIVIVSKRAMPVFKKMYFAHKGGV